MLIRGAKEGGIPVPDESIKKLSLNKRLINIISSSFHVLFSGVKN
jgi:hypothetical protein